MTADAPVISPGSSPWPLAAAPVTWINLDRRRDRRVLMETLLAGWPGEVERFPGVDGRELPVAEVAAFSERRRLRDPWGAIHANPASQLGCTRSHRLVMERLLDRGVFPAIVLEDDIVARAGWWKVTPPDDWRIALLAGQTPPSGRPLPPTDSSWVPLPEGRWYGAMAYALADAGVAELLRNVWRREEVICDIAWSEVLSVVPAYAATPAAFLHDTRIPSDLVSHNAAN